MALVWLGQPWQQGKKHFDVAHSNEKNNISEL